MKNIKLMIFTAAALTLIASACNKPAAEGTEVDEAEVIVAETVLPQDEAQNGNFTEEAEVDAEAEKADNMSDIQELFSGCQEDADCAVVFPSCCKEAYAPYFVNKQYEQELIKEYKRITGEPEKCPEVSKCPRSYFGGAKAACVSGRCLESLFDTPAFQ